MKVIGDLLESFSLYAICDACSRCEAVDLARLVASQGHGYPIERIRMRLRCTQCRQRSGGIRIVYVGPQGRAAGFRYSR